MPSKKPSLAETHPDLAAQADGWNPTEFTAGSGKKVGWLCDKKHQWKAAIYSRTSGNGCPYCAGKSVLAGFNDLASRFPTLAVEANGWEPSEIHYQSKKRLPWKCNLGHEWITSVHHRVSGTGCPVCSNRKLVPGINDFATLFPKLAKEAFGWDPTKVSRSYKGKVNWKCGEGHVWSATIFPRTKGVGCPVCADKRVLTGVNDLSTTHPVIAAEASGWDPSTVINANSRKLNWVCPKGHLYSMTISARKRGAGCAVCNGKQVMSGATDLETLFPEIASQANGWDPKSCTAQSNKVMPWICAAGHIWRASIQSRTLGNRCPICFNKKVLSGYNDLKTTHPELAKEACGWDPSTLVAGSNKKVLWRCNFGHEWHAYVSTRVSQLTGCPVCSNHVIQSGFNDLQTLFPEIAIEACGWDPSRFGAGSHHKKTWKCSLGHTWEAGISSRTLQGTNCVVCANKKVLAGFNDLATTHPHLVSEVDGWDPETVVSGSNKKLRWKCYVGHSWVTSPNKRVSGRGCPSCAKTGFDPEKDGWLYLLRHERWEAMQIGISNVLNDRIRIHTKLGWELIDVRGPMKGELARGLEQSLLHMFKVKGIPQIDTEITGKFTGYTESWLERDFRVSNLTNLMSELYIFEQKSDYVPELFPNEHTEI